MVCKPIPRQSFKQRRHRRWRKQKTEKPICQLCQDVRQSRLLPPSTIQHALKFSQMPISNRSNSRLLGSTLIFFFFFCRIKGLSSTFWMNILLLFIGGVSTLLWMSQFQCISPSIFHILDFRIRMIVLLTNGEISRIT